MANRFTFPRETALDANGDPLPGAKLEFYEAGTTSPADTFADEALTVANTNPVVADSAGRFGDIFLQAIDHKVILKDSTDVTIWTADPVSGTVITSGDKFIPSPQNPADMTVLVGPGTVWDVVAKTRLVLAAQTTPLIVAPSSNPRNDVVYIDQATGTVGMATGAEASGPTDPVIPNGKLPVARLRLATTTIEITSDLIDDIRELELLGAGLAATKNTGTADGDVMAVQAGGRAPAVIGTFGRDIATNQTTDLAIGPADVGRIIPFDVSTARTPTLPLLSDVGEGFAVGIVRAAGTNAITVNEHATDGGTTIIIINHGRLVWIVRASGNWVVFESSSAYSFIKFFESAEITLANGTVHQAAHGLGERPKLVQAVLRCVTAESGYSVGDEVVVAGYYETATVGATLSADTTNVTLVVGSAGWPRLQNKSSAAATSITLANWKVALKAWA